MPEEAEHGNVVKGKLSVMELKVFLHPLVRQSRYKSCFSSFTVTVSSCIKLKKRFWWHIQYPGSRSSGLPL